MYHFPIIITFHFSESHESKYQFLQGILRNIDTVDDNRPVGQEPNIHVTPTSPIFGNICLPFLENECYGLYLCPHNHTLLAKDQVQRNLEVSERADIELAHNDYLLKYEKLMENYWPVFARCYGYKKWPEYLRRSIKTIAVKGEPTYLRDIVNGLVIGGTEYHTAIDLILLEMPESMDMEDRLNLLWEIVLDARNKKARAHLKAFEPSILNATDGTAELFINKLLAQLVLNELVDLKMFCIGLLKHCATTTLCRLDNDTLDKFIRNLYASDRVDADAIARRIAQFGRPIEW